MRRLLISAGLLLLGVGLYFSHSYAYRQGEKNGFRLGATFMGMVFGADMRMGATQEDEGLQGYPEPDSY